MKYCYENFFLISFELTGSSCNLLFFRVGRKCPLEGLSIHSTVLFSTVKFLFKRVVETLSPEEALHRKTWGHLLSEVRLGFTLLYYGGSNNNGKLIKFSACYFGLSRLSWVPLDVLQRVWEAKRLNHT